jgi:hypothetical protein
MRENEFLCDVRQGNCNLYNSEKRHYFILCKGLMKMRDKLEEKTFLNFIEWFFLKKMLSFWHE